MRRPARGQAVVELALGLLVLVTILLFGIHFGELGYLSTKVHEAQAAALWDSTAYRTHEVMQWYDSSRNAVPAGNAVNTRYADFDGRASVVASAPQLAMTRAGPIQVTCRQAGSYALPAPNPYGEPGGISCAAEAELFAANIPTRFADRGPGGFFNSNHLLRPLYTICGTGRFTGGSCGNVEMLLGDLGLHDGSEQNHCTLSRGGGQSCADNPNFYAAAFSVFNQTRPYTGIPEAWARRLIPDVPRNQLTGFYMSFRGEDSPYGPFREQLSNGDVWETTPYQVRVTSGQPYLNAYQARNNCLAGAGGYCWLGKINCN